MGDPTNLDPSRKGTQDDLALGCAQSQLSAVETPGGAAGGANPGRPVAGGFLATCGFVEKLRDQGMLAHAGRPDHEQVVAFMMHAGAELHRITCARLADEFGQIGQGFGGL